MEMLNQGGFQVLSQQQPCLALNLFMCQIVVQTSHGKATNNLRQPVAMALSSLPPFSCHRHVREYKRPIFHAFPSVIHRAPHIPPRLGEASWSATNTLVHQSHGFRRTSMTFLQPWLNVRLRIAEGERLYMRRQKRNIRARVRIWWRRAAAGILCYVLDLYRLAKNVGPIRPFRS